MTIKSVPLKQLGKEKIDALLSNVQRFRQSDMLIDPGVVMAGPLYSALWTLACAATVLAREYLESQPNAKSLMEIFQNRNVSKYLGKTMLAFGVELDEIDNLTTEAKQRITQVFFEKVIIAVNEETFFVQNGKYPWQ